MEVVPLYAGTPLVACQEVTPELYNTGDCTKCSLHKLAGGNSCLKPTGRRGSTDETVLVVGGIPAANAPSFGTAHERWVMNLIRARYKGNVVFDYAIKCPASSGKKSAVVNASHHNHCRPYLATTLKFANVDRVIVLGNHATKGVLGYSRGGSSAMNRGGYTYIYEGDKAIPVFILSDPQFVYTNSIKRKHFAEDLEYALTAKPEHPPFDAKAYCLDATQEDADFLLEFARKHPHFTYDCETYSRPFNSDFRLLSVGLAFPGTTDTIGIFGDVLYEGPVRDALVKLFADESIGKKGQNIVYDLCAILSAYDVLPAPVVGDSRLAYKLLNSDGDAHLEQLAELIGMGGHKQEADEIVAKEAKRIRAALRVSHPGRDAKFYSSVAMSRAYAALPKDVNIRYVCRDALTTELLCSKFEQQLKREHGGRLWQSYIEEMLPSATAYCLMNMRGVPFSSEMADASVAMFQSELTDIQQSLAMYGDVNPSSSQSVATFVYDTLGLPVPRGAYTPSGAPSADKKALARLAAKHPAVELLLKHREYEKLIGMLNGFRHATYSDGRLRPSFLADGTSTGRVSATGGLHQVPTRTEHGKMVKSAFVAKPGYVLLQADYSTLEIRIAAMLSGDAVMIDLLNSGVDFHLATAKMLGPIVWHIEPEEVENRHNSGQKMYRTVCKTINFATLYGQSAKQMAENITGMLRASGELSDSEVFHEQDAENAQRAILGKFVQLGSWIQSQQSKCGQTGDVWTWWDGQLSRRRQLYDVGSEDRGDLKGSALRSSYNTPIQGTGAKFCNMSLYTLVPIMQALFGDDAYPVLAVHDSIICEVRASEDMVGETVELLQSVMMGWNSNGVPLGVDFEVGKSWGELHSLSELEEVIRDA